MKPIFIKIVTSLVKGEPLTDRTKFLRRKKDLCGDLGLSPVSNASLNLVYRQLVEEDKLPRTPWLEKILKVRTVRTLSGVTPITVLTKPFMCPGKCVYCPTEVRMPKSYLSNEPAAQRAVREHFDPYNQVKARTKALEANGHTVDKIELLVLGGTWSAYPRDYQEWFVKRCFDAANLKTSRTLLAAQKLNEKAKYRIIGVTLETRPDFISASEVKQLRKLGCTRVQLGVQHTDNEILDLIKRGHHVEHAEKATMLLKQHGFKIDHHYMPDLPGSTPAKDLQMFVDAFQTDRLQPDQIKIYPCIVNEFAELNEWYKNGQYQPYNPKDLFDLLLKVKKLIPPYVRINRLIRDIPGESIIAGNKVTNLRQDLQAALAKQGIFCQCLRCREAKQEVVDPNNIYFVHRLYRANNGIEHFLSWENKDRTKVYAFCRLRFNDPDTKVVLPELKNAALLRELHTYGQLIPVWDQDASNKVQHLGLGKSLMAKAEELAKQQGFAKMAVISGIGVRQYYRALGYKLQGTYMVKGLK